MALQSRLRRRAMMMMTGGALSAAAFGPRRALAQSSAGTKVNPERFPKPASGEPDLQIIYPQQGEGEDPRDRYPTDLLRFALDKAGVRYGFRYTDEVYTQKRAILSAEDEYGTNIVHAGAAENFAAKLDPIYFPTTRGLLGLRVFLINRDDQAAFSAVDSLSDLADFRAVQGIGWPDVDILEHAGLNVTTHFYDTLFRRVAQGYADYFPRGAIEVMPELDANKEEFPQLALERSLALSYKFDVIFYTSPHARDLHDAIERGLWAAYEDRSFFEFFDNHPVVVDLMDRLDISGRRVFELDNPFMPEEMYDTPDDLWLGYGAS